MDDEKRMSDAAVRNAVEIARDLRGIWTREHARQPDMDATAQVVMLDRIVRFGEEVLALRADVLKAERARDEARAEAERLRAERARRDTAKAIADAVAADRTTFAAMLDDEAEQREMAAGQTDDAAQHHDLVTRAAHLRALATKARARGTEGR